MKKQLTKTELDKVWQFAKGQSDCKKGRQAITGQSENYYSGFGFAYELEQIKTARSEARAMK